MMKWFVFSAAALALAACVPDAERKDRETVRNQQEQYAIAQPVPTFDWSLERDVVIQLYRARNERVATHTVWRSDYGMVEGDCPSIGYPIPYDTSLTNPVTTLNGFADGAVVEQPEPNGLFASKNSIATWVRCIGNDGSEVPIYIESKVTAYPFSVAVDYNANRVQKAGEATFTLESRQ